jgi:hypothetical protein
MDFRAAAFFGSQHASIFSHQEHEAMPAQLSDKPANASEVRTIVRRLDDATIVRIVATSARGTGCLHSVHGRRQFGTELERTCGGRVPEVVDILEDEAAPEDER